MLSRLYECRVLHHRFAPKAHRFEYRIFLFALDLDELAACDAACRLFSVNRPNLYSFCERDYLSPPGDDARPLKERVVSYLKKGGVELEGGKVLLVTLPRIFGYAFNPVSFYFCYDPAGDPMACIAEVTNTFRERKCFLLGPETRARADSSGFRARIPKLFYVSPYSELGVEFDFVLRPPEAQLALRIDDFDRGERTLTSTLAGPRRALSDARLLLWTFTYPLLTLRVILLIHWHAARLWFKRVPWFPKGPPVHPSDELPARHR